MLRKPGIHYYLVIVLFAVYLINGLIAIPRNSVTYDEMDHWSYGKRILMRKTDKIYPYEDASAMPVTGLNAIPRAVQQVAQPGLLKNDGGFSDIMNGRYITFFICLLTGFIVYRWSKELFGENGGLMSLLLFVFCPNLTGHGILLTTDAYTALATLSTAYFYWKYTKHSGWKNFLFFCISIAIAQLVKYSMLHLFFIFGVLTLLQAARKNYLLKNPLLKLKKIIVAAIITIAVINIGFLFNNTGKNLKQLTVYSKTMLAFRNTFTEKIRLPLPEPYITGLDMTLWMNKQGAGHPSVSDENYLLGKKKTGEGFWYYYIVLFLFKTPLLSLFFLAAAIIFLVKRKKGEGHPSSMLFLLGLMAYFLLVSGIQNNVQIGIRHVLMIFPLLYVLAGYFTTTPFFNRHTKWLALLIILYFTASYYYFFPNLISYSNELVTDKKNAYRVMADSNLDFGQGRDAVQKYFENHPGVCFPDTVPAKGIFAVGINDYLNLKPGHKYEWTGRFKPFDHIYHCYLLIEVTDRDLKNKN
jgi:hypothetical protein